MASPGPTVPPSRQPSHSFKNPLMESSSRNLPSSAASSRNPSMSSKRSVSGAMHHPMPSSAGPSSSSYYDAQNQSSDAASFGTAPPRKPSKARHSLNGGRLFSSSASRSSSRAEPSSDASNASHHQPSSSRTASSSYSNRSGMSALARANANARRVSMNPQSKLADTGTLAQAKKLTVDSTSFDEWMKMATDNKINPTNTFSIALIDYFHDMSLLRSDSGDGSINFQKASCTLDGCVKVWTSRVDSVVTETGKLLNGLVGDGKGSTEDDADLSGEIEVDENGNAIGVKSKKDKRKRNRAKEATLVKNFSAIAVKKLDLEYTVDPLFKKTSADFDEGGAGGLLMNHLGVDDRMRIVFDAGEAPGLPEDSADQASAEDANGDADAEETVSDGSREATPLATAPAPATASVGDLIDITRLQSKLFSLAPPSLLNDSLDPLADLLQGRQICPTMSRFSFAPDQQDSLFGQDGVDSDEEQEGEDHNPFDLGPMNAGNAATPWGGNDDPAQAFSFGPHSGPDDDGDESGVDLFGVPAELDQDAAVFGLPGDSASGMTGQSLQHDRMDGEGDFDMFDAGDAPPELGGQEQMDADGQVHWDPRHGPSQHDLLLAFKGISGNDDGEEGDEEGGAGGSGGLFDYFDQRLMKNWAGPEHWKMRSRLAGFGGVHAQNQQQQQQDPADSSAPKKKKPAKEAFVIDFTSDEGAVNAKELFEAPRNPATTCLPKGKARAETYLLPEDHHFSSKSLLKLFTKPRAVLNIRTRKGGLRFGGLDLPGFGSGADGPSEVDGDFWAQQQAAREAEGGGDDGVDFGFDEDQGPMPLNTQFFHDGDDEGAFDMASAMPQADPNSAAEVDVADYEEEDLAAQAAALKRVKPEYVNYAKKAKRVDVRKLKENIWKELGLEGVAEKDESATDSLDVEMSPAAAGRASEDDGGMDSVIKAQEADKQFRSVLSGLRKLYPKDKLEEISTSFCFICLLHLANEEGLELQIGNNNNNNGGPNGTDAMLRKISGAMSTLAEAENSGDEDEDEDDDGDGDDPDGSILRSRNRNKQRGHDSDSDEFGDFKVGRLEFLRIKKDPTAGRSA